MQSEREFPLSIGFATPVLIRHLSLPTKALIKGG